MVHVSEVTKVDVLRFAGIGGDLLLIHAVGDVPTSGWSGFRLAPRYPFIAAPDGIWEFDFVADPPGGLVLEVVLQVSATTVVAAPDGVRAIKVYAADGSITSSDFVAATPTRNLEPRRLSAPKAGTVLVKQDLVSYDDSFNPIGFCSGFHVKMKKLHHTLALSVEGPDEGRIRNCVAEATGIGLIAAIVAVYATGGGALSAAIAAFVSSLEDCLGNAFTVRVDDHSDWIEWCA